MQLFALALILGLLAYEYVGPVEPDRVAMHPAALVGLFVLSQLILGAGYHLLCVRVRRRLGSNGTGKALRRLDRATLFSRWLLLLTYMGGLHLGLLEVIRDHLGDWILLDELLMLAGPLAVLSWQWAAYHPIERRLREALLMSRLDRGLPVPPLWTRRQYVLSQFRHQVALILAPMLLMLAWIESVQRWTPATWTIGDVTAAAPLQLVGVAVIMLLAPLVIRFVWDTAPLPAGELRDRLEAMCRRHRVRVRELLLWRTFGAMANAAVMGFVPAVRYILLTDALLEMVGRRQVEAIMAHELGHVRRRHVFWLLAAAAAALGLLETIWHLVVGQAAELARTAAASTTVHHEPPAAAATVSDTLWRWAGSWLDHPHAPAVVASLGAIASWVFVFGWISRRFEQQADTFAVQHLVGEQPQPQRDARGRPVVDAASAGIVISALEQVADLNHMVPHRKSWRHGSIRWRQDHLRTLIGQPVDALPIDRLVQRIKLASAAGLVALSALVAWAEWAGVSI